MTFQHWLQRAIERLADSESPKRDAEILLTFVTGKPRTFLLAFGETVLTLAQQRQLEHLLVRRARGEPIAYIIGQREFWSLPLNVSPATLIPRPDTEKLVELALTRLPDNPGRILDLGTGSGAIALALANERPDCDVIGVDSQADAVLLAQENAANLTIANATFIQGNWFEPIASGTVFDVIVSNPPYIDAQDPHLHQGDVRFEPSSALIAALEGLADIQWIVRHAPGFLKTNGWLLLEHGWTQGRQVRALFHQQGFKSVASYQDYGGNERVTLGCW